MSSNEPRRPDRTVNSGNSGSPGDLRPEPTETRLVTAGDYLTDAELDRHITGSRAQVLQRQKQAYGGSRSARRSSAG